MPASSSVENEGKTSSAQIDSLEGRPFDSQVRRRIHRHPFVRALVDRAPAEAGETAVRVRAAILTLMMLGIPFLAQYAWIGIWHMTAAVAVTAGWAGLMLWALDRGARPALVGESALAGLFGLVVLSNVTSGGFYDPNMAWLLVVPVCAAAILGPWVAVRWTIAVLVAQVGFFVAAETGVAPPSEIPEELAGLQAFVNALTAAIAIGVLIVFFVLRHRRAVLSLYQQTERLRTHAEHDALTGLLNRPTFEARVQRLLDDGRQIAVLYVDLDGIKSANDAFGHAAGDLLLTDISARASKKLWSAGVSALVCREGYSFLLAVEDTDRAAAAQLSEQLVEAIGSSHQISDRAVRILPRVGIALSDEHSSVEDLVGAADVALVRVKRRKVSVAGFSGPEDLKEVRRRVRLDAALGDLDGGALRVLYQPLCDIEGRVLGAEALLRFRSDELGDVSPDELIDAAERSGQIVELGAWVFRQTCEAAASWPTVLRVSINVSPVQLRHSGFVETVSNIITECGMAPERVELEVTESVLVGNADSVLETLERLRGLGVSIALDDFGTGYSSLAYLRQLPVERLKIDRSFVCSMHEQTADAELVRTIVGIGKSFGLTVLAEGVEEEVQLQMLRGMGCDEIQGYLLGRPETREAFVDRIGKAPLACSDAPRRPRRRVASSQGISPRPKSNQRGIP
ncbi:MAG: EAL domain-containing protein [Myxococcota bacterium]